MALTLKTKVIDKNVRKRQTFVAEMSKYRGAFTEVGIFEDAKPTGDEANKPENETIADYANNHEFGIGVPKRPFMRTTFNKHRKGWEAMLGKSQLKIMIGKDTVKGALFKLGLKAHTDTKKVLRDGPWKPLADTPYKREKDRLNKNKVLINTGTMHNAITFQVKVGSKLTKASVSQAKGKV